MDQYIDGFVLPIPTAHLETYKAAAEKIAEIWKEYGALSYQECIGDDMSFEGVASFVTQLQAKEEETIIFGWVVFPSKEIRDIANAKVPKDPRMSALMAPLLQENANIFDGKRMLYGGFRPFIHVS